MRIPRLLCTLPLVCAATLAFSTAPSFAQDTLKMNISVGAELALRRRPWTRSRREVEKRTGGRYKVQNFYSGALGAERESIEAVQLGTLDLTMTSTGPVPNFVPEVAIFDIPFLFRDYAHARARARRPDRPGDAGQVPGARASSALAWTENGFRHMTNNRREVNAPDDLKGLKMRTMENPVHMQAYKQFGIIPTPMAFTEVFTALQQGTVDGQENPMSVILAAKFDAGAEVHDADRPRLFAGADPDEQGQVRTSCRRPTSSAFAEAAKEARQGQPRAHRRRRRERRRGAPPPRHDGGEKVDKAKFQAALAPDLRGVRQEVRRRRNIDRISATPSDRGARRDAGAPVPRRRLLPDDGARARSWRFERRTHRRLALDRRLRDAGRGRRCLRSVPDGRALRLRAAADWSEVLVRFTLIWMVFVGVAGGVPRRARWSRRRGAPPWRGALRRALEAASLVAALAHGRA